MTKNTYTIHDIHRIFSNLSYRKGLGYFNHGKVKSTHYDHGVLLSEVEGSHGNLYDVFIQIMDSPDGRQNLRGICSCPIGDSCKHVIATLLQWLKINDSSSSVEQEAIGTNANTPTLDHETLEWIHSLEQIETPAPIPRFEDSKLKKKLIYIISVPKRKNIAYTISAITISLLKNGDFGKSIKILNFDSALSIHSRPEYVSDVDIPILRLLYSLSLESSRHYYQIDSCSVRTGLESKILLGMLLDSNSLYLQGPTNPTEHLIKGEERNCTIHWKIEPDGMQRSQLTVDGINAGLVLPLEPLYYVCKTTLKVGPLVNVNLSSKQVSMLLYAPPIAPQNVSEIREKLTKILPATGDVTSKHLLPQELKMHKLEIKPIPKLTLTEVKIRTKEYNRWREVHTGPEVTIAAASLSFNYDSRTFDMSNYEQEFSYFKKGEVFTAKRDFKAETESLFLLHKYGIRLGIEDIEEYYKIPKASSNFLTIGLPKANFHKDKTIPASWEEFVKVSVPKLKEAGWNILINESFPYNITTLSDDDEFYTEITDSSIIDWFGVELGVILDGKKLNLISILLDLLKRDNTLLDETTVFSEAKPLVVHLKDGRKLLVPHERANMLVKVLRQIFNFNGNIGKDDKLQIRKIDAHLIAEIDAASHALQLRWFGGESLRKLGKNLKDFTSIAEVKLGVTFKGELRPYQQDGLNWLQFLKNYGLAGILADDMGLGKTVQCLAHIAKEVELQKAVESQVDKLPFLVIAPTSLMVNWKMEAERFTPDLKVLTLHGPDRKKLFDEVHKADLVLTTYPLLPRDKDALLALEYHTVILDEAQVIKNSRTQVTQIANQLKTKHRLCMTGTPMENHLGELWSLFNFLLPGYLGTSKQFTSTYRSNIEKDYNRTSAEALNKRIKPFILRRTKQEVATELPPKTEMVRVVELEGMQRDLYETIRVSMHDKVRKEIETHGVAKSHIIVLDALLKLRQVCCDPSLLKIDAAKDVKDSAKLTELMNMLKPMIEEGRKILLFSQFTSMLGIIEKQLKHDNIEYAKLTGSTIDRETPIRNFQDGKVPLFLISLKAGGVGLNLTAADTVIHYDPWWNPAVENQATDRAYRIGQDKPIFVYKLIVAKTVEEKILEMQNKKRKLMDSLFDPNAKTNSTLTASDIQVLFEPMI